MENKIKINGNQRLKNLEERLRENDIKPGIENKQYIWGELSEEEIIDKCEKVCDVVKEKYPSPSPEAYKYCRSLIYFKKKRYGKNN